MSNQRYLEEFRVEAVRQVTGRGLPVADVADRLGNLYAWIKRYSKPEAQRKQEDDQQAELRCLQVKLKRVTKGLSIGMLRRSSEGLHCEIAALRTSWTTISLNASRCAH